MRLHAMLKEDDRLSIKKKLKDARHVIEMLQKELDEAERQQSSNEMLISEVEDRRKKFGRLYEQQQ